jgi:hypothetical protein
VIDSAGVQKRVIGPKELQAILKKGQQQEASKGGGKGGGWGGWGNGKEKEKEAGVAK